MPATAWSATRRQYLTSYARIRTSMAPAMPRNRVDPRLQLYLFEYKLAHWFNCPRFPPGRPGRLVGRLLEHLLYLLVQHEIGDDEAHAFAVVQPVGDAGQLGWIRPVLLHELSDLLGFECRGRAQ